MAEKVGGEFLVNTTTQNTQSFPSVTELAGGGFVVTWTDYSETGGDTDNRAIRGQAYDADGTPRGSEFLVNTTTENYQSNPSVAGLSDGGFVVTWEDFSKSGADTTGEAVRGQAYDADGTRRGDEFLVNTVTEGAQQEPSVTGLSDGGFVVVWEFLSGPQDEDGGIAGRLYDADGAPRGSEFLINSTKDEFQGSPSVSSLSDGGFVVVWDDDSRTGGDTSQTAIRGQAYNADGTARGGEFLANSTTLGDQEIASVTGLTGGGFVVTWESDYVTSPWQIQGQVYSAAGTPQGGEFVIDSSGDDFLKFPSVTDLTDGGFVVTWIIDPADPTVATSPQIRGQVYNGDGTARGADFLVTSNTSTGGGSEAPSVAGLSNGGFIVTWVDRSETGGDTDGGAIRAQVFDATGTATPSETIDGTVDADDLSGGTAAEVIKGLDGQDEVRGGGGDDQVYGNRGADEVYGNQGDDLVFGGRDADAVFGGQGVDQVYGNLGNDQVYGNLDDDLLFGGQDDDDLFGGGGADQIYGNLGDDRIYGNKGDDTLFGGGGSDEFAFFSGDGQDTVGDFAAGDTIEIAAGLNGSGIDGFVDLTITANDDGDAEIDLGNGNSLTLQGVSVAELSESDFSFF